MKSKQILLCIDDSDASRRAVRYVGDLVGETKGFEVSVFHLLGPLPPELRESPGAESPQREEMIERQLTGRQQREIELEKNQQAVPIMEEARSILLAAGVSADAIVTATSVLVNREDLPRDILKSARARGCRTIVVGRESFSWIQEVFREHLADQLIADGDGLSICTVQ
jgi:enamine deaminase RidA (YjgF/YER057c/UK114 family)